jgi:hypothetical protein
MSTNLENCFILMITIDYYIYKLSHKINYHSLMKVNIYYSLAKVNIYHSLMKVNIYY